MKNNVSLEGDLWLIKVKLKGIAHLLQSLDTDIPVPLDLADCYFGIGEIINECAEKLTEVTQHVAKLEINQKSKKKKR